MPTTLAGRISADQVEGFESITGLPIPRMVRDPKTGELHGQTGKFSLDDVKDFAEHPLSAAEAALRVGGSAAIQLGSQAVGARLGGGPGERAGGAAGSVASDFYQRFLNHMFGEPNAPVNVQRELMSAASGALIPAAPTALEAASGLRTSRRIATGAAAEAGQENVKLAEQQAKIRTGLAEQRTGLEKKIAETEQAQTEKTGTVRRVAGQKALAKANQTSADLQSEVAANRLKLRESTRKQLEQQRGEAAQRVGTEKVQGMLGKTPQQLQQQEATVGPKFAAMRAKALGPVFDGARQYHEEVGKLFEPYIGPRKAEQITGEALDNLGAKIEDIKGFATQHGQNLSDTELTRIFSRIDEAANPPSLDVSEILKGRKAVALSNADWEKIEAAREAKTAAVKPLTVGELWGYRSRLGQVLSKSNNPAVRLAAHEAMDTITEMMPDIPATVKQQYGTQRVQFPPRLMREVATARNPGEVGAAIFGSPTTPEPAGIALNLIDRAKTPEAQDGLRAAFADNWLSKTHNPDDILRYNPAVLKDLYGEDAKNVIRLFGPEGTIKSASWQKLIAASPQAKADFDQAYRAALTSAQAQQYQQAIVEGTNALKRLDKYGEVREAIENAKVPEDKVAILKQKFAELGPTEKQADTLAKQRQDIKEAATAALTKGIMPQRMERYAEHRLAFDALIGAAGGSGLLMRNPQIAVAAGALIGPRAAIRMALKQPAIARAYVNALALDATPSNAKSMGKIIGQLTGLAALDVVKDVDVGVGEPITAPRQPDQATSE